jgi:hypothetical protein
MFRGSVKFKNEVHIIVYLVILQSLLCLFPQFQMHNWDRHTQQLTESSLYFSYLWSEGSYGRKSKMQVTIALSNWKTFGKLIATQNSWWNCRYLCHHQRLKGWKEWWFLAQIKFHYLRKFAHPPCTWSSNYLSNAFYSIPVLMSTKNSLLSPRMTSHTP